MSSARRTVWMRSGLLALVVFALLAYTLHSLRLSDASFSSQSKNAANVFVAGTLSHDNNRDQSVLITLTGARPGSSQSGVFTLTGTGDLTGDYTMSVGSISSAPLGTQIASALYVLLEDTDSGDQLCDDPIAELDPVELGSIAPFQTNHYRLTLYYPDDGVTNGAAQSSTLTATLLFQGVSQ